MNTSNPSWSETDSQRFIDYGHYLVPQREQQMAVIGANIPVLAEPFTVLELACGAGLLAEVILQAHPQSRVIGLDRSAEMRAAATARLAPFGKRFSAASFNLEAPDWRTHYNDIQAVVSSLTIHHLDGPGKQALFRDLHAILRPGGALVIADVVEAPTPAAQQRYADEWDAEVLQRAHAVDGTTAAYDFFVRERWNMYRYADPDDYDKPSRLSDQLLWLREAGFVDVDAYWMLAGHAIFGGRVPV